MMRLLAAPLSILHGNNRSPGRQRSGDGAHPGYRRQNDVPLPLTFFGASEESFASDFDEQVQSPDGSALSATLRRRACKKKLRSQEALARSATNLGFNMEEVLARVVEEEPDNVVLNDLVNLDTQEKQVLETQDLLAAGCTIETLSQALYDTLHCNNLPNFLPHVNLDRDGGLDRIDSLWTWKRYLFCILQLTMALGNLVLLVTLNWTIFQNTFCSPLVQEIMRDVLHGRLAIPEQNLLDEENLFHDIRDVSIRRHFMAVASVTATAEACGVVVLTAHAIRLLVQFAGGGRLFKKHSEYKQYTALDSFFRKVLPMIGTFSALKLAALVHPAFLYCQYIDFMGEAELFSYALSKSISGTVVATLWFVVTRGFCAVVALMAFGVKLVVIGAKLCHPQYSGVVSWLEALALLNSCIGCVLIEQQLQDRLFLFLFGGSDAEYQDNERSLRNVYRARVTKQIWTEYAEGRGKIKEAIALLATLDHYDLQTLLIEDMNNEGDFGSPPPARSLSVSSLPA